MADGAAPCASFNVHAEQALIGAVLVNPDALDRAAGIVKPDDFADAVHARIWAACCERVRAGCAISPALIAPLFAEDPGIAELGGVGYLARLAGAAVSVSSAPDYARAIAEASARRRLIEMAERATERARDAATSAADVLASLEGELLAFQPPGSAPRDRWLGAAVADAMREVWEAYQEDRPLVGVTSGLPSLDRITGGWKPGRLIVMAGRPGMGKSAVAIFFAWSAARAGHGVQFSSLEMGEEEVSARLVALQAWAMGARVDFDRIMRAQMTEAEAEIVAKAAAAVGELPIRITGPLVRDLGAIAASAKRSRTLMAARDCSLDLIIVDYLGLVRPPRERMSKVHEIGDVTGGLKLLSRALSVPVLTLSQLNRGVENREDKRPNMSDLRDSGDIEQDADQILFPFRQEYYTARAKPQGDPPDAGEMADWEAEMAEVRNLMEIDVAKNRQGRTDKARLFCAIGMNAFSELAR